MDAVYHERLAAFSEHIRTEPSFAFLHELSAEHREADWYVVGGIVRDVCLNRDGKDYDFVIRGVPAEQLHTFLAARGTVNLVGRTFGVLKFRPHGWPDDAEDIDIALPRREFAEGTGGYRDFDVQADHALTIEEDLSRRDFTVNAMALHGATGTLIDPFDGRSDLEQKVIRAVGAATDRFTEDRSRMLRSLRFASQLTFTIAPETMEAIRAQMPSINEQRPAKKMHEMTTLIRGSEFVTPREVIARELIKSFVADPVRSLDLWDEAGAVAELMPELLAMKGCAQPDAFHSEGDVWTHTRNALAVLHSDAFRAEFDDESPRAIVVLGVLLHDAGKPPTQKTPERDGTDRIRFDGHDIAGGAIARAIARRLALAAPFPKGDRRHVDPEELGWIIDHHLLLLADPNTMRNATIERYFFHPTRPGDDLQRVTFCDGSASIPQGASVADLAHFRALRSRIRDIAALRDEAARLPPAILDGKQIMELFNVPPGKKIGELKDVLREEQLRIALAEHRVMTPEEAAAFLSPHVERDRS